jgi:hypothetical protein
MFEGCRLNDYRVSTNNMRAHFFSLNYLVDSGIFGRVKLSRFRDKLYGE